MSTSPRRARHAGRGERFGLNFFDHLTLLTSLAAAGSRGPGFGLVYRPPDGKPVLYAGSRRGIPYQAGPEPEGPHGRYVPGS